MKNAEFRMLAATVQARLKRKPKLNPLEYAQRLAREMERQQERFCSALALWRTCRHKACRRHRACCGDAKACLGRALDRVPHRLQWQARDNILRSTPHNIGAPERAARQRMPRDFYEGGDAGKAAKSNPNAARPRGSGDPGFQAVKAGFPLPRE